VLRDRGGRWVYGGMSDSKSRGAKKGATTEV
jgi:hypothetical protein